MNSAEYTRSLKDLRSIFSFTEVKAKRKHLPSLKTATMVSGHHQSKTGGGHWDSFLKSTVKIGNLSPRIISESTRNIIKKAEEAAKQ